MTLVQFEQAVVPDVQKIAVLRANGIGDFLFALPALEALRATYPYAEIVLLAKDWHAAFLTGRPSPVDRVVVVPPSKGINEGPGMETSSSIIAMECFLDDLQQERFDLALQLHGGGRYSNPFILRIGARITAGARTPDAAPLDRWIPYIYYQPEIMRYLEIVSLVGARPVGVEPRIVVTEADRDEAQRVVPQNGQPLVALHPGAGDPRRQWPPAHFAAVGDTLAPQGARVVVVGTEPEQRLVTAVIDAMAAGADNLCGRLSLGGLAGLLSRCQVVVSNDSGPLHLAAAAGVATVGIYWCGNMITAGHMTRSRHRPAISWRLHCPVCGEDCTRTSCEHRVSFVADVPVQEVVIAAWDLFASNVRLRRKD